MGFQLGKNAKLYRQTTGTRASWGTQNSTTKLYEATSAPSNLDEVTNVRDLKFPLKKALADVSIRGSEFRLQAGTLKEVEVTFGMVYDSADADMVALMTAYLSGANIALAILDGDKTTVGTIGMWADFQVTSFEKTEDLEGAQMVDVTVIPGYSAVVPEMVKLTAA